MPRTSKAEAEFKQKYPFAHVRPTGRKITGYEVVAVYAGDYICAEGLTAARAYASALRFDKQGLITPDPLEQATHAPEAAG